MCVCVCVRVCVCVCGSRRLRTNFKEHWQWHTGEYICAETMPIQVGSDAGVRLRTYVCISITRDCEEFIKTIQYICDC